MEIMSSKLKRIIVVFLCAQAYTLSGCTTAANQDLSVSEVDPYEDINRKVYAFNMTVDEYVAEPVANAYKTVAPDVVRTGVNNFFGNLKTINTVINDVLQGKFQQSAEDSGRFLVNSTVGLGGLLDVATDMGLEHHEEDFDQTFAVWGVPQGSYLMLPFLGPSTTRGIPGSVLDTAANPATYVGMPVQALQVLEVVNARANADGALKFIDEAALDPYVFTRESYLQWRNNLINDGNIEINDDLDKALLDFDEALFDEVNDAEMKSEGSLDNIKPIAVEDTSETVKAKSIPNQGF